MYSYDSSKLLISAPRPTRRLKIFKSPFLHASHNSSLLIACSFVGTGAAAADDDDDNGAVVVDDDNNNDDDDDDDDDDNNDDDDA